MNFFNMFFKTHLLEKPLSQILQSYESSFSWTEPTWLLGSHFCVKFDNKLNTWIFLKLSLCGGLIHFFWEQLLLQFGLLHFCVIVQSHELFQHVFQNKFIRKTFITNPTNVCFDSLFENNSHCNLGFHSFLWLFNLMNFFNMLLKTHLLQKPLSQILQFYESTFSWTEAICFLGSHFLCKLW